MKKFDYVHGDSIESTSAFLQDPGIKLMAGGTDLLGVLKDNILPEYPDTVVGLQGIDGLDKIEKSGDKLVVGAMAKLSAIADSKLVKDNYPALASAAYSVAAPNIRNKATIGGNVCQDVRCWYYRYPDSIGEKFDCVRKNGEHCYAMLGENRYHSIFGSADCAAHHCSKGCPAGTDIPAYMNKIREGDWAGAAEIVMRVNPMPMITSRICPHPCQDNCSHCLYGESVAIHCVERAVGDYILAHTNLYYPAPAHETGKKIVIVGAGPGGLTCAYYLRKAGHTVTVYDKMPEPGGVLRYGIPPYRLPHTILDAFTKALAGMGIEFKTGVEVGKDVDIEVLRAQSDGLYLGTGAWKQPVLGLQGENLTQFGLDFLVEVNTYLQAAIGNDVLVCGGGNVAMDVALTAVRLGAKHVKLVCLEQKSEMPASAEEIAMAEEEGVAIYNGWGLGRIVTDQTGNAAGLEAKRCLSVFDGEGHFSPVYDEQDTMVLDSDCIILATGQRVDINFLGETFGGQLKSVRGLIDVEDSDTYKTKVDRVYAGGDAVTGPNIAIRAIRAGGKAAAGLSADLGMPFAPVKVKHTGFNRFNYTLAQGETAAKQAVLPVVERTLTAENERSLDRVEAAAEAGRCMNCGCIAVNPGDIAPVLLAAGATVKTNMRTLSAEDLLAKTKITEVLNRGEIILSFELPCIGGNTTTDYAKYRLRSSIDFAIVSLATSYTLQEKAITRADIVLGACAPIPVKAYEAENYLVGKTLTKEVIECAAELALADAVPLEKNAYKIDIAKALVRRSLEALM